MGVAVNTEGESVQVTITQVHGCLVANLQTDLGQEVLDALARSLLSRIGQTGARGVVLDFSGLAVLGLPEFEAIRRLIRMAELLGAACAVVGLNAGIVAYLVTRGADTRGLRTMFGLTEALEWFARRERR